MSLITQSPRLLNEFPVSTHEEWQAVAVEQLEGEPFDKKLLAKTYEGVTLQPLYAPRHVDGLPHLDSMPGFAPYVRGTTASGHKAQSWDVAQRIALPTPEAANAALRHELERGLTAINLTLDAAAQHGRDSDQASADEIGRGGVSLASFHDVETLFDGIDLEQTPISIRAGRAAIGIIALMARLFQSRQISLRHLRGSIGLDPLGMLVTAGNLPHSLPEAHDKMAAATRWANTHAPRLNTILVQATPYHESGGNAVQELAFAAATGAEYLREMVKRGVTVDEAAARTQFVFAVGANLLMEIAKLRAARLLWAKIVKAFGGGDAAQKMAIHLQTSVSNKTAFDSHVNLLRATVEAFAGVVGGCGSLDVGAFDALARTPDEFSRRIARNTQIILREEAHLNEVIDPAGGSWCVEALTDELARSAWKLFQEVERLGGMAQALLAGFPQQQIRQTAAARAANIAGRRDVIVGVNMYANVNETPLEPRQDNQAATAQARIAAVSAYRAAHSTPEKFEALKRISNQNGKDVIEATIEAASAGATLGDIESALRSESAVLPEIEPLTPFRGAAMFEELRAAVETHTAQTGRRPTVFLANMGGIAQHKARADFSLGFFEVAGFQVVTNAGFPSVAEAANAALASGAPVVVICSTDDAYPALVPPLTQQIKAAKPDTLVALAGYPKDHVDAFKQAGVDEFIHIRANVCETLNSMLKRTLI